jgi:hypothetical protein
VKKYNLFYVFFRTIGLLVLFIAFGLFFDSSFFIRIDNKGQLYANVLMLLVFAVLFYRATKRSRELMLYAVLIGICGEYLFSLGFEMYGYRLGNVPTYVPPGHAIIYIVTVYFCREKYVKKYKSIVEKVFAVSIFIYSLCFLIFATDVFGFVLTLLTLWLLRNKPRERLFYYSMYIVVAFLEIIGTTYNCWYWPSTAFGEFDFLQSANPPSGISFFYFGLDLGSLWLYKQRHKIAWGRMKGMRALSSK